MDNLTGLNPIIWNMCGLMRSLFFHYNKPASQKANKPQISLHYYGTCYIVDSIICDVPTSGKIRKIQPYFIMTGKCTIFEIIDKIGYLR